MIDLWGTKEQHGIPFHNKLLSWLSLGLFATYKGSFLAQYHETILPEDRLTMESEPREEDFSLPPTSKTDSHSSILPDS